MSKFYGLDKFQVGDAVQIATRVTLDEFSRTWKLHHPLQSNQFQHAGQIVKVVNSFMYHGGDILYELEGVPGRWHQQLLAAPESQSDGNPRSP
jgi:hypothetical protein